MKPGVKNIDDYISSQPDAIRPSLEHLRRIIKEVAPEAEELISYQMPAFRYHGMLVGFAAAKNHFGLYPWNGHTVEEFKEDLKGYSVTKGAIHFPIDKPIPEALVKKIVKARMQENLAKSKIKVHKI